MEGDSTPTWAQHPTALLRPRRRLSPPFIDPVMLILLIPILTLIIIFLIIPSFISHTSNIIKPISVRRGWDYFNIGLVLFAILCGVFGKRNDDVSSASETTDPVKSEPLESSQWYDYPDRRAESSLPATGGSRLRRNSSYTDFRQASDWETGYNQFRFYDDYELIKYRSLSPPQPPPPLPEYNRRHVRGNSNVKIIPVDTFEIVQSPPPAATPPPPPSPATVEELPPQQSFRSLPKNRDYKDDEIQSADTATSPPPLAVEKKLTRSDRRKSGSAKEIATAIADSVYRERKRKRRQRMKANYEKMEKSPPRERPLPPPTLPPQPPPPPSSFYNIFKNKKVNKNKKVHSLSAQRSPPPPPPLPPSPRSIFNNMFKTGSKSKRFQNQSTSAPPPPPPLPPSSIFNNMFKTGSKSKRYPNQSSSAPPPPPPPPPSSIFNNMFKSGSKSKRFQNQSSSAPPPPPPLPPSSIFNNIFKTGNKSKRFQNQFTSTPPPPPPPPPHKSIFNNVFKSSNKSNRSHSAAPPPHPPLFSGRPPLPEKTSIIYDTVNYIPAPPPLPPFQIHKKSFARKGDFVRILSARSSFCSSPELEDVDIASEKAAFDKVETDVDLRSEKETSDKIGGGNGLGRTVMCPSPDVNMKAESFIARLKGEWRLEKMNSMREMDMEPNPRT